MPLRETNALSEWGHREDPPYSVWEVVVSWVQALDAAPWQAPSVPMPEFSNLPYYEVRSGEVPGTQGIEVFYRREFDGEVVDLMWTENSPLGTPRACWGRRRHASNDPGLAVPRNEIETYWRRRQPEIVKVNRVGFFIKSATATVGLPDGQRSDL